MKVMLPLAYPRWWFFVGVLMILAIVSGSLAPGKDIESVMLLNDKIMHASAYTGLALWFTGIYPRSRYPWVALGLFTLGALMEVLQGAMSLGRERDFQDLVANSAGIVVGLLLAWTWCGGWAQWVEARFHQIRTR